MYKDLFVGLGLNENEAVVYEYLLKHGKVKAGDIIKNTDLKRGAVYLVLADLVRKNLVSEAKVGSKGLPGKAIVSEFSPQHPENLRMYLENQEKKIHQANNVLESNLSMLVSDFNLVSGRPGVRYFEGLKGVKKVLWDTLTSKETLYSYSDIEAIVKYIDKVNLEYVKEREEREIKKKAILIDSPFARNYLGGYHTTITENKFVDAKLFPFNSLMQIYDGKVAYVTLSEKNMIGVIIEDKNIYQMHKSLFEFTWLHARD
jgi:sugar-specific transcriptional regulator TrmB